MDFLFVFLGNFTVIAIVVTIIVTIAAAIIVMGSTIFITLRSITINFITVTLMQHAVALALKYHSFVLPH